MRGYKEERRKEGMASRMRHFLHGRGRRFCAAIMCVSLLAGNVFTSIGASVTETAEFKIEQEDLKAALQKAVDKKRTEKAEFEFKGEEADRYAELFDTEDGTLYKLSPDVSKENGSGLSLSIYARLTDEFEKEDSEDTYEITGDEEIIFLLKNGSAKEKKAVIYVGDQCTDVITVVPGSSIKVEEETPADLLEEETVPDADEMEDGAGTAPSGNGGDSSTTGEISESDASDESNAADPTDESNEGEKDSDSNIIVIEPDKTNPEEKNDDVKVDTDVEIIDKKEENENTSDKTAAGEEKDSEDTSASNGTEAGAEQSDSTSKPEDNKADEAADTSGTEKEENKTTDTASDDKAENEKAEPEKKSHDNASDDNSDTKSDDSSDAGEEKIAAAISEHYVVRVAAVNKEEEEASPSDALPEKSETEENEADEVEKIEEEDEEDEEEASPSEATPSELYFDMEGEILEAVRLGDNGVVAFVTTADALGLDDIIYKVELDKVTVRVAADRGVLPENVTLAVDELLPEGDTAAKYEEAETALKEAGTEYSGMMALDIRFLDENEAEVEPNGNVKVSIKMNQEVLPEEVAPEAIAVQHLREEEGGIKVETVADVTEETQGTIAVQEEEGAVAAHFEVESFSSFTITWKHNVNLNTEYKVEFYQNQYNTGKADTLLGTVDGLKVKDGIVSIPVGNIRPSNETIEDKNGNIYKFYGWSTNYNANYTAGDFIYDEEIIELTPNDAASTDSVTRLYAIWGVNARFDKAVKFYVRLDGVIPNEPSKYPPSAYTKAIVAKDSNGKDTNDVLVEYKHIYNDEEAVAKNIKVEPSQSDIQSALLAAKVSYNPDKQEIIWYVVKYEEGDGFWHVDGVLRDKTKWNLRYDANCSTPVENIIPNLQYSTEKSATVHNTVEPGKTTQVAAKPVRSGYYFRGWNTKQDGTGDAYQDGDKIGPGKANETIILYAQWQRKTDILTVTKVWVDNNNATKMRPGIINLTISGVSTEGAKKTEVVTLTSENVMNGDSNTWSKQITLPQTDDNGNAYVYTVSEPVVPEGYQSAVNGFTVTNTLENRTITVQKKVEGNMGDKTTKFNFTYKIENGTAISFALCDGESYLISNVPYGAQITINELNDTYSSGYKTSFKIGKEQAKEVEDADRVCEISKVTADMAVLCINNKNIDSPPTGLFTTNTPYLLMLAFALCSMAAAFFYKRRASRV